MLRRHAGIAIAVALALAGTAAAGTSPSLPGVFELVLDLNDQATELVLNVGFSLSDLIQSQFLNLLRALDVIPGIVADPVNGADAVVQDQLADAGMATTELGAAAQGLADDASAAVTARDAALQDALGLVPPYVTRTGARTTALIGAAALPAHEPLLAAVARVPEIPLPEGELDLGLDLAGEIVVDIDHLDETVSDLAVELPQTDPEAAVDAAVAWGEAMLEFVPTVPPLFIEYAEGVAEAAEPIAAEQVDDTATTAVDVAVTLTG